MFSAIFAAPPDFDHVVLTAAIIDSRNTPINRRKKDHPLLKGSLKKETILVEKTFEFQISQSRRLNRFNYYLCSKCNLLKLKLQIV
jgi:hypothetical protein